MYIVIYDKITKKIVRVIEQTDKVVSIGYSDNLTEKRIETKPEGDTVKDV